MRVLASILLALLLLGRPALAQSNVVNVYNWSDYIDASVLDAFTKETGIKVVYDTYDSNETLETKLLAGKTDYDVVVPSATFLARQIKAGVYQPLDRAKLPNWKNLWPDIMARQAAYDPGNRYAANYMWYTTGIAYNVDKAKARLGSRAIDTWATLFRPDVVGKFNDCGVYMLDSPEDALTSAMKYVGLNPDSKRPEDIRRAAEAVARVKPSVKKFNSSEYINALANGDICLALGWSGDAFQARNRAREAANGVNIDYAIPKEGALMSLDTLAIPRDAPHADAAYAFIDFLMRPEVAAKNTAATNFANGVLASKPLIDPAILDNPSIYPTEDVLKTLYVVSPNDPATQKIVTREWTRVKTGR